MTLGLFTLGAAADVLVEAGDYSGFAYPSRLIVRPLIPANVGDVGMAVLQDGPLTHREATLRLTTRDTDEFNLIRGYEETHEELTFTDEEGADRTVIVSAFSPSGRFGNLRVVTLTLLEISAPVPPGS